MSPLAPTESNPRTYAARIECRGLLVDPAGGVLYYHSLGRSPWRGEMQQVAEVAMIVCCFALPFAWAHAAIRCLGGRPGPYTPTQDEMAW